jgi:hypothetical protein
MNHFIPTQRRGSCPSEVLSPKLVVPPVEFSDLLAGPGFSPAEAKFLSGGFSR